MYRKSSAGSWGGGRTPRGRVRAAGVQGRGLRPRVTARCQGPVKFGHSLIKSQMARFKILYFTGYLITARLVQQPAQKWACGPWTCVAASCSWKDIPCHTGDSCRKRSLGSGETRRDFVHLHAPDVRTFGRLNRNI